MSVPGQPNLAFYIVHSFIMVFFLCSQKNFDTLVFFYLNLQ